MIQRKGADAAAAGKLDNAVPQIEPSGIPDAPGSGRPSMPTPAAPIRPGGVGPRTDAPLTGTVRSGKFVQGTSEKISLYHGTTPMVPGRVTIEKAGWSCAKARAPPTTWEMAST